MIVNDARLRIQRSCFACFAFLFLHPSAHAQNAVPGQWLGQYAALYSMDGVRVVATQGGTLYAGGQFNTNNSTGLANYLAQWTTNGWVAVGGGLNGPVQAITVVGNDVYVGGTFTRAGGVAANNVARWDGASWHALGSGLLGTPPSTAPYGFIGAGVVNTLATDGTNLFAGGAFTSAGPVPAQFVAAWDGSSWSPMGLINAPVNAITFANDRLYAASTATFTNPEDFSFAGGIVQWVNGAWRPAGLNLGSINQGNYYAIAVSGPDIYVGGDFQEIGGGPNGYGGYSGGIEVNDIAHWNGESWSDVDGGVSTPVYDGFGSLSAVLTLEFQGRELYAGGVFSQIGMAEANPLNAGFIAKWDGTNWFPVGPPGVLIQPSLALPYVTSIAFLGGELVVAGSLGEVGALSLNVQGGVGDLARFNGMNWALFGSGVYGLFPGGLSGQNAAVLAMVNDATNIYLGGNFTNAAGTSAGGIARVTGAEVTGLKGGVDGPVQALLLDGANLYAGGAFSHADGVGAPGIARWDGSNWYGVGGGLNGTVYALAKFGGRLVAAGNFHGSGANSSPSYLAVFDGNTWSAAAGGVNGPVYSLLTNGGVLYAGGAFSDAGGTNANSIAAWDGTHWHPLGSGLQQGELTSAQPGSVYCLALMGANVYAGGQISLAGGAPAAGVASWDGRQWSALTSGLSPTTGDAPTAKAMLSVNGNLYVTGENLTLAGGVAVSGLAVWTGSAWETVAQGLQGYPFELAGAVGSGYALTAFNGEVLIGGAFGVAGGLPASGLAAFQPAFSPPVVPPSLPALGYFTRAAGLTISWPAAYSGFTLESSPNLDSGPWVVVAGSSSTNSITIAPAGARSFFRLRQ
jgi:hypothetical protein